jgi:glycosyltransferase involved in cell wall biosynthesis
MRPDLRVALVHDWLTGMRGGERCLEVFCELFPDADLFTLLHVPGSVSPVIERHRIITSFVQRLPQAAERYRFYLPLFPAALRAFDFSGYDLVLSASHAVAKAARQRAGATHVCYCFTPMRYVWDLYDDYFGARAPLAARVVMPPLAAALRRWDRRTSARPDRVVAISRFVAERIRRVWRRDADVIYPPVDVARYAIADDGPREYYLVVAALVPYKRVDLAVAAATRMNRRLLVVGAGPEARRLAAVAGPTVELLGWRSDAEIAELYARCRAVLFPAMEDFGIVPLEAMAAGRPVVAYGVGGATETVIGLDGTGDAPPTGVFFPEQTVESLVGAMTTLERNEQRFEPKALRARAEAFDRPLFRERIATYLAQAVGC